MSRYLTSSEVARALGVADSTVRGYRKAGKIVPAAKTPGGHARYELEHVRAALSTELAKPQIIGLAEETFAPLGTADLRPAVTPAGPVAREVFALTVREAPEPERDSDRKQEQADAPYRWGGRLLNARVAA